MLTPPRAQLRVYVDVDDLPPDERAQWSADDADRGVTRDEAARLQEQHVVRMMFARPGPATSRALVRRAGKRRLVCPLDFDTRTSWAWGRLQDQVSPSVLRAMVPDDALRETLTRNARSARAPAILDQPWVVPLHWYLAFAPEEGRRTDAPEADGPRVRYLTTVGQAADRVDRMIRVVTDAITADPDGTLTGAVELAGWLDAFPDLALLELDYGGLAREIDPARDHACRDLHASIDALEAGDVMEAVTAYSVARACWSDERQRDHTN